MAKRSEEAGRPSLGASWSATKRIAPRPSSPPVGATRNTRSPSPGPASLPTAPVSQNSDPRPAAAVAAGLEMVLP